MCLNFGGGEISQEEFVGASGNTRKAWDCGKCAAALLILRNNLGKVLDIDGSFVFLY